MNKHTAFAETDLSKLALQTRDMAYSEEAMISGADVRRNIKSLFEGLKNRMMSFRDSVLKIGQKKFRASEIQIPEQSYVVIANWQVQVPVSFTGNVLNYLGVLEQGLDIAESLQKDTLNPALIYFSKILRELGLLKSPSGVSANDIINHVKAIGQLRQATNALFDSRTQQSTLSFQAAFRNVQEYKDALLFLEKLDNRAKRLDVREISRTSDEISKIIDTILLRMQQEGDDMSNMTAADLSQLAYDIAVTVDYTAGVITAINTMLVCMQQPITPPPA